MRISDWSSEGCSSELVHIFGAGLLPAGWGAVMGFEASTLVNRAIDTAHLFGPGLLDVLEELRAAPTLEDKVAIGNRVVRELAKRIEERKSVVSGKSVSVRVDLGGRRIIQIT